MSETLKILKRFSDGAARDVREGSSDELERIKWLYEEKMLKGIDASTLDGPGFLSMSITQKGLEFLKKELEQSANRPTREAVYEKKHPIRAHVVKGVSVVLLSGAIAWVFSLLIHRYGF